MLQNNIFPELIIGQKLITVDRVSSTNDYLKELMSNFKPLAEGTAILAVDQFGGKGQRGSSWVSEAGKNITVSFWIKPQNLGIHQQFYLSAFVSIGVANWLKNKTEQEVYIKWPNDIYIADKKIGGILIENSINASGISSSVCGIGLNINQEKFSEVLHNKVSSLKISNKLSADYPITDLCKELLNRLDESYQNVLKGNFALLLNDYNARLYRKGRLHQYLIHGQNKAGIILDVQENGYLNVLIEEQVYAFGIKEIRFLP